MSALRRMLSGKAVAYHPPLARALGGIAPALFFQQLAHWQGNDETRWVFRTQEELEEELAMSPKVQATCRRHLLDGGFIEEERRAKNRLHYRPVWENVEAALETLPSGRSSVSHRAGTELPNGQNSLNESKNKSKEPSSPKGSDEPDGSANGSATKDRITLLVDRCREMDFEPTPKQKLTWGNELNAKSRHYLQGRELMRLVNLIARAGSDGYFWSFSRAERELGKPGAKSAIGATPAEDPNVSEEEKSSPYDLGAYLDRKRRTA